ncbi:MAG: hypothetical protein JWQ18_2041 [Conexibacter sp.]|nr:hypothetical protein [Conexibacter sp.]
MDSPLDRVLPEFAHREVHTVVVDAAPELVWTALHEVSGRDLPVTRLLTMVRGLGARGAGKPLIDRFVAGGFGIVLDEPPRALAIAAAGQPWKPRGGKRIALPVAGEEVSEFVRPGFVLMAMSFGLEPLGGRGGGRTRLSTETRVQPTDAAAARTFRPYWMVVRAGSGIIRHELLRAVKRKAEKAESAVRQAAAGVNP